MGELSHLTVSVMDIDPLGRISVDLFHCVLAYAFLSHTVKKLAAFKEWT